MARFQAMPLVKLFSVASPDQVPKAKPGVVRLGSDKRQLFTLPWDQPIPTLFEKWILLGSHHHATLEGHCLAFHLQNPRQPSICSVVLPYLHFRQIFLSCFSEIKFFHLKIFLKRRSGSYLANFGSGKFVLLWTICLERPKLWCKKKSHSLMSKCDLKVNTSYNIFPALAAISFWYIKAI